MKNHDHVISLNLTLDLRSHVISLVLKFSKPFVASLVYPWSIRPWMQQMALLVSEKGRPLKKSAHHMKAPFQGS